MSFGVGLACGMGAGFSSGIAAGIASGRKQARDEVERNLRDAAVDLEVTIRDRQGQPVPFNQLVQQVLPAAESGLESAGGRKLLLSLFLLGVCLMGITSFFYFMGN